MADDHYVPQFLLRQFAIPNRPGRIWMYRRNHKPTDRVAIKSLAQEDDFDLLLTDGVPLDKDYIAKMYQDIESDAAPIIHKLNAATSFTLTKDERKTLSIFISHLVMRTPFSRESLRNLFVTMRTLPLRLNAGNKEHFEAFARGRGFNGNADEIESLRQHALNFEDHFKIETPGAHFRDFFFLSCVMAAESLVPYVISKVWTLRFTTGTRSFVTSDNPIVIIRPEGYPDNLGIGFRSGYIYIPISTNRALFLVNGPAQEKMVHVKREAIDFLNDRMISAAYKHVYASEYSVNIEKAFNKTKEGKNTKPYTDFEFDEEKGRAYYGMNRE